MTKLCFIFLIAFLISSTISFDLRDHLKDCIDEKCAQPLKTCEDDQGCRESIECSNKCDNDDDDCVLSCYGSSNSLYAYKVFDCIDENCLNQQIE
mmetsp:Transcript_3722/g.3151  ORF Transcript_3722/g.3151 Transcript_3722/m.3151 type:complete len:95 (+) Transcript_3722:115-399(+)